MMLLLHRHPIDLAMVTDKSGAQGSRGRLEWGDLSLPVLERLEGYKRLPVGDYEVEHAMWTGPAGRKARALRVLGPYSRGRIYIHSGNFPKDTTGCVLVGLSAGVYGVNWSRMAMTALFMALGGWEEGRRHALRVTEEK